MRDLLIHTLIGTAITTAITTGLCLLATTHPKGRRLIARGFRAGNALRQDPRIPRGFRWALFATLVLPIPGEFDEMLALVIIAVMWPRYGHVIRSTWANTATA